MDRKIAGFLIIIAMIFSLTVVVNYKHGTIPIWPLAKMTFVNKYNSAEAIRLQRAYLNIVRDTVCGLTLRTQEHTVRPTPTGNYSIQQLDLAQRLKGRDWPFIGITMTGPMRLMNLENSLRQVIRNKIPGDFMECGVWRGGSSLYARAVFYALGIKDRKVWLADSFQGLPRARTPNDVDWWSVQLYLKVPLDEVKENFRAFGLLNDQVQFCQGMDGDMYESTMDQLFHLYSKLQVGGILIIDDFDVTVCKQAINDFRKWHDISEHIIDIGDDAGAYWVKTKHIVLKTEYYAALLNKSQILAANRKW
ncbi:unnamed protein product [Rotaria magnacalcarata]